MRGTGEFIQGAECVFVSKTTDDDHKKHAASKSFKKQFPSESSWDFTLQLWQCTFTSEDCKILTEIIYIFKIEDHIVDLS